MIAAVTLRTGLSPRFPATFARPCCLESCARAVSHRTLTAGKNGCQQVRNLSSVGAATRRARRAPSLNGLRVRTLPRLASDSARPRQNGPGSALTAGRGDSEPEYRVIYRFPYMKHLRVLSRLKIAQTLLTAGAAPVAVHLYLAEAISRGVALYAIGAAAFALAMLYAMSFYLRRVVGLLYLHRGGARLRLAHLGFWGRRLEESVPVADVVPLAETGERLDEALLSLRRYSTRRRMYLSLRYGQVVDRERFCGVFGEF